MCDSAEEPPQIEVRTTESTTNRRPSTTDASWWWAEATAAGGVMRFILVSASVSAELYSSEAELTAVSVCALASSARLGTAFLKRSSAAWYCTGVSGPALGDPEATARAGWPAGCDLRDTRSTGTTTSTSRTATPFRSGTFRLRAPPIPVD